MDEIFIDLIIYMLINNRSIQWMDEVLIMLP